MKKKNDRKKKKMNYDFDSHKRLPPNDTHLISHQDHPKLTVAHVFYMKILAIAEATNLSNFRRFFPVDPIKDLYLFFLFYSNLI